MGSEIRLHFQSVVANLAVFCSVGSLALWGLLGKWSLAVISCPAYVVEFLGSFNWLGN